jgi:hypothetical protein
MSAFSCFVFLCFFTAHPTAFWSSLTKLPQLKKIKMKKIILSLSLIFAAASCTYKYTPETSAMINITDYDIGNVNSLKTGESCYTRFFLFPALESSTSVIDAMRNGGISKIKMVDKKVYDSFFVYKSCTVVHGL